MTHEKYEYGIFGNQTTPYQAIEYIQLFRLLIIVTLILSLHAFPSIFTIKPPEPLVNLNLVFNEFEMEEQKSILIGIFPDDCSEKKSTIFIARQKSFEKTEFRKKTTKNISFYSDNEIRSQKHTY